jgi:hypothetical protein
MYIEKLPTNITMQANRLKTEAHLERLPAALRQHAPPFRLSMIVGERVSAFAGLNTTLIAPLPTKEKL